VIFVQKTLAAGLNQRKNALVMADLDPILLQKWLRRETERSRFTRVVLGLYYNHVPSFLGWRVSPLRLIFGSLRGLSLVAIALWPLWIKFYDKTATLTWREAGLVSVLVVIGLVYNYCYDKGVKNFKEKGVREKVVANLSNEIRGMIFELSKIVRIRRPQDDLPAVGTMRKNILECIQRIAQIHLDHFDPTDIYVTLLIFDDAECSRMRIVDRTTKGRPVGKVVESEKIMAFYVADSLTHRAVLDFLRDPHPFEKAGLSTPDPTYRSILLIPILDLSSGCHDSSFGVVCIDSSRPYHFWPGSKTNRLVVKVSPYCMWLALLLGMTSAHKLKQGARMKTGGNHV
jgi:hypothetical protein